MPLSARTEFIHSQARVLRAELQYTSNETGTFRRWLRLAIDTYDAAVARGETPHRFAYHIGETDTRLEILANFPIELAARWREWRGEYDALLERSPRLVLYKAIYTIGENHDHSGWPIRSEWMLLDWVESGRLAEFPLDDRRNIIDQGYLDQLQSLKEKCNGWLYCDQETENLDVVFVPRSEWATVRAKIEAERQRRIAAKPTPTADNGIFGFWGRRGWEFEVERQGQMAEEPILPAENAAQEKWAGKHEWAFAVVGFITLVIIVLCCVAIASAVVTPSMLELYHRVPGRVLAFGMVIVVGLIIFVAAMIQRARSRR